MIKKLIAIATMATLCFGACNTISKPKAKQQAAANGALAQEQTFRINIGTEPPTLDPRRLEDLTSSIVLKALFEGLTRVGPENEIEMAAAESVEISKDQKTYIFKIRDAKWSNGDKVSAYDFEYAWKQILSPKFDTNRADTLYVIKNGERAKKGEVDIHEVGVSAPNESTLIIALENPTPYFLELISNPEFSPVHRGIDKKYKRWSHTPKRYVSNGPFKLKRWEHNYEIEVVKNKHYWDADQVKLQSIQMLMVGDAATELNLFEAGDLDWAGQPMSSLPTDVLPALAANGVLENKPQASTYMFLFNTNIAPFNVKKMRQAMALAINRKDIVENITQGKEQPAQRLCPPTVLPKYTALFTDNDTEKARRLFDEALDEMQLTRREIPTIMLAFNTNEAHRKIAQAVQEQWRRVLGLDVQLENTEWKVFIDKINSKDYMVARYGWIATISDPIDFLIGFSREDHPNNPTGWYHMEYSRLIELSQKTVNPEKRLRYLEKAEKLLLDECPLTPLYHHNTTYIKKPTIQGMYLTNLGHPEFKYAYKVEEPAR